MEQKHKWDIAATDPDSNREIRTKCYSTDKKTIKNIIKLAHHQIIKLKHASQLSYLL